MYYTDLHSVKANAKLCTPIHLHGAKHFLVPPWSCPVGQLPGFQHECKYMALSQATSIPGIPMSVVLAVTMLMGLRTLGAFHETLSNVAASSHYVLPPNDRM